MSGVIKPLIISMFLMLGVYLGLFGFYADGISTYSVSSNNTIYNNSLNKLENMTSFTSDYQDKTLGNNSIGFSSYTSLGFIFNGFTSLSKSFLVLGELLTGVTNDAITSSPLGLPSWLSGLIISIIFIIILTAIVAYFLGRGTGDI